MKKIFISASVGFVIGVIIAGISFYFITLDPDIKSKEILVKQISGEKINHKDYSFKGKVIKFTTQSEGKGVIETEIPKDNITEVINWNHRVHGFGVNVGMIYHNGIIFMAGPVYEYRWKNISFNVSILAGKSESGYAGEIIGGAKYWIRR